MFYILSIQTMGMPMIGNMGRDMPYDRAPPHMMSQKRFSDSNRYEKEPRSLLSYLIPDNYASDNGWSIGHQFVTCYLEINLRQLIAKI